MTGFNLWDYLSYDEPKPCKHQPVDNGTRRSECALCKIAMEFRDMQWVAVEQSVCSANTDYDARDGVELKGLAAWLPAVYCTNYTRIIRKQRQ